MVTLHWYVPLSSVWMCWNTIYTDRLIEVITLTRVVLDIVVSLIQSILTWDGSSSFGIVTVQLMLCSDPALGFCTDWDTSIANVGTGKQISNIVTPTIKNNFLHNTNFRGT